MSKDLKHNKSNIVQLPIADADGGIRHVFVKNYLTRARIGVWDHEKTDDQTIRVNIDLSVQESRTPMPDELDHVVCYDLLVQNVEAILSEGHVGLVETLAEKIAAKALEDERVIAARIRLEKLNAIEGAESVGIEIERRRRR